MLLRDLLVGSLCALVAAGTVGAPRFAEAATIQATVTYTGTLGPVGSRRPLCLCVYLDADLRNGAGCYISSANGVTFQVGAFNDTDYFLIAFLDLSPDEILNPDEPYEIYRERGRPPADPITTGSTPSTVEITFGDENLPSSATPSPTSTLTVSPTATATPQRTPVSGPCGGDCDGSGHVVVNEVVTLVNIALGRFPNEDCSNGDSNHNDRVEISEIVAAVNNAVLGCPGRQQ